MGKKNWFIDTDLKSGASFYERVEQYFLLKDLKKDYGKI